MMDTSDLVRRLRSPAYWISGSSAEHEGENDAPYKAADAIERLEERCAAYKGQVEYGAAEMERLKKDLRTVQNAAKTIASSQGTELQHLRENYRFDHALRGEVESLREANSILTEQAETAEAERDAARREVKQLEEFIGRREDDILHVARERDALRQEIGRLKELLAPFAVEANEWGEAVPDDHKPIFVELGHWDARYYGSPAHFTVGDQRRARAALKQEPKT